MLHRRAVLAASLAIATAGAAPGLPAASPLTPFKLFDTHAHFHSNDTAIYPFRVGVAPEFRADSTAHPVTAEIILKAWDAAGVEMGCGVQFNNLYYTDNRFLLHVAGAYPRRILPIVVLDPVDPSTPGVLENMVKAHGVAGVRFADSPDAKGDFVFLTDSAQGVWEMANALQLAVVLLPTRSDQPNALPAAMRRVGVLAVRYPKVNIVMDHVGFPVAENTPTFGLSPEHLALAAHKNVYYKYTTFLIAQLLTDHVPPKDFLNYVVEVYGADHVIWGSAVGNNQIGVNGRFVGGAAIGDPSQYGRIVKLALDSSDGLTLAQRRAIFHDTAKGLFVPGGRTSTPLRS